MVSQQYRASSDCMYVQTGLALYWCQRLITFGSNRIRIKLLKFRTLRLEKTCQAYRCIPQYKVIIWRWLANSIESGQSAWIALYISGKDLSLFVTAWSGIMSIIFSIYRWCRDADSSTELVRVTFPLVFDVSTEYLAEMVCHVW